MEPKYSPEEGQKMVEQARDEFFARCAERLPAADMPHIKAAYNLAADAHSSQIRMSGIPYITHPIAVARIALVELGMNTPSIMAALLHDVVEDTEKTVEDIRQNFGEDVAFLVDALTKKNDGKYKVSKQIDNFKLMLDTFKYDIRALLIKLSDRLHNMRTLASMSSAKQMKIASETDYFYAPLANRLGLYNVKSELENLSLKFRSPLEYERIERKVNGYMRQRGPEIEAFIQPIREVLESEGIEATVTIKPRSVYALWRKMQASGQSFRELEHVHLVNVIFHYDEDLNMSEKNQCLRIYSLITDMYKERPYSMINYVDQPKENGYQALHVQVMSNGGVWNEVHICTEQMYRNSCLGCVMDRTESIDQWVQKFRGVLKQIAQSGSEGAFMESVIASFYNDDILVFTPKGDSIVLPKDATALDMAFEIHTQVGIHAKYARINGRLCSIFTTLHRGDRVDIGTDDLQLPEPHWLQHVCTYNARRAINTQLSKSGYDARRGEGPTYVVSKCCNPLPGDEIVGFKQPDGTIFVHKCNCKQAISLSASDGDSIVKVDLPVLPNRTYPTRIQILSVDRACLLSDLIRVISAKLHLSMDSVNAVTNDYIVTTDITMQVPSANELSDAIRIIEEVPGVEEVRSL